MERGMFGILLFSGLCHFADPIQHHWPLFISEPKTWLEARQYCREKHTNLATVNDQQDLTDLAGLIQSGVSHVFLGLYRGWGWSVSDADDYKEGEPAYWNWASGQPVKNSCGSLGPTGEWFATNCSSSLSFICYSASTTDISKRFILGEGTMDWFAAQDYCRRLHTDLARVRNQVENEEVQKIIRDGSAWIGLTWTSWMWSDGSEPSFTPWKPPEPQFAGLGDCGVLDVNSNPLGMIDLSCDEKLPFFCDTAPLWKHLVRLKLAVVDSSVDLTEPTVMASVLKWVERKLRNKVATEDIKLSWRKFPEKKENAEQEQTKTQEVVCVQ